MASKEHILTVLWNPHEFHVCDDLASVSVMLVSDLHGSKLSAIDGQILPR
jgi:hypothetical protein